jgi:hypothetical protein
MAATRRVSRQKRLRLTCQRNTELSRVVEHSRSARRACSFNNKLETHRHGEGYFVSL